MRKFPSVASSLQLQVASASIAGRSMSFRIRPVAPFTGNLMTE
jgi:hypothetical protein